ncbi:hypothetical protein BCR33DRAFT_852856 [Rhizoclosmatium globosum]|uniref:BAG domain-containing protein n=1 Tax=Rhizoclosmatium globosum TaxID=329046 RepID=A0A1Y2BZ92_9FUNG|nr:hypothetical protein BCR33DRAFT_852856 [Rhizoclosmatium globosum]|eukprot:ORY40103.1 hypothetical protein BCR33DRAFT_852856 [Rhizoclosmatium globosum]
METTVEQTARPSVTRTIPIRYANEVVQETPSATPPTEPSSEDTTDMETEDTESTLVQPSTEESSASTPEHSDILEEDDTEQHLGEITNLAKSFYLEFPPQDPEEESNTWKTRLENLSKSLEVNQGTGKLVLGAKGNRPLLEVEEKLTKFLLKLDAVESNGVAKVREARRKLIKEVQTLLDDIEQVKLAAARKQTGDTDEDMRL